MFTNRPLVFGVLAVILTNCQLASVDGARDEIAFSYKTRVEKAFEGLKSLAERLLLYLPLDWVIEIIECIEQDVSNIRCHSNFSIDIFNILNQCLENPGLRTILKLVESETPTPDIPIAVLSTASDKLSNSSLKSSPESAPPLLGVIQNIISLAATNYLH